MRTPDEVQQEIQAVYSQVDGEPSVSEDFLFVIARTLVDVWEEIQAVETAVQSLPLMLDRD